MSRQAVALKEPGIELTSWNASWSMSNDAPPPFGSCRVNSEAMKMRPLPSRMSRSHDV